MIEPDIDTSHADRKLADRLKALRIEKAWSLDALATRSGVSRATLSRLENGEVSPTASVLGRICAAYGTTMSRLMAAIEAEHTPLVRRDEQIVWTDTETGFERRNVSPPADSLGCEVLACRLPAGTDISYPVPPREGLEHHLVLTEGRLEVCLGDASYELGPGDCLRYRLFGTSRFRTGAAEGAAYFLVVL